MEKQKTETCQSCGEEYAAFQMNKGFCKFCIYENAETGSIEEQFPLDYE